MPWPQPTRSAFSTTRLERLKKFLTDEQAVLLAIDF